MGRMAALQSYFQDSYMTILWLSILILLLIVEIITVGLTCIWAAGGALVAMLLSLADVSVTLQIVAFLLVTAVLLIFTRPFAVKVINSKREKTNYEGIIGKTIRIVERVDNMNQTGMAVVNGQEWTVRAETEQEVFEPGSLAKVTNISGVKLIVKRYEED